MTNYLDPLVPDDGKAHTLTLADLDNAMKRMHEEGHRQNVEMARRAAAWGDLNLDWDAMTGQERALCSLAVTATAVHPRDAERVAQIIAKYRRRGGSDD